MHFTESEPMQYLEVAKATKPHGIKGEIKMFCLCDSPDSLRHVKTLYLDPKGHSALTVKSVKNVHEFAVIAFDTIDSIEKAERYRGQSFYAARDEIKKDEESFFICDLIGLSVIDAVSGEIYGTLQNVFSSPANDIYSVKTAQGEVLVPAVPSFIQKIDPEKGIFITPIPGLFPKNEITKS